MKNKIISKSLPVFSLIMALIWVFVACDPGPRQGPKSGEAGEEPEAYGLQEDDLPGVETEDEGNRAEGQSENSAQKNQENDVAAGEFSEEEAMYPAEKIEEETNLNSNDPLELDAEFMSVSKKMLMSTLNGHRTDLEHHIRELQQTPGNSEDSSVLAGNVEKLRLYLKKLDIEMAKVRGVDEENFGEVAESAQATIQGAGALIASRRMRITQGY
ncbi:hypothetical protein [Catalinimonas niigatensis]|uniref:hypothetical protein n=1 Tax=Catalinimonas niigatensis TaxID=1397264 RepID=UPI0026658851|nr:hypothetical protein [Catalinimonas niigatensis]WPP48497.1 hypothetical protein PZB72_17640 [Catalinimonas niigatensis]